MSDIGLHYDGLVTLLAMLVADALLLIGLAVCMVRVWVGRRRMETTPRSRSIRRHMAAMLTLLVLYSGIGLLCILHGLGPAPSPLEFWLDQWLPCWMPASLLVWPVIVFSGKRRQVPAQSMPKGITSHPAGTR